MRAARSSSPACIRRAARRRCAAAGSTSPTSCSACRSRRRCSTVRATCACPAGRSARTGRTTGAEAATLTFNLGVRYELIWPFYERSGQMVNLDVAPDFTAAVPVISGRDRAVHRRVSRRRCCDTDTNNVAPRVGVRLADQARARSCAAATASATTPARTASIARQLAGQPPFAVTEQRHRHRRSTPLTPRRSVRQRVAGETTNTYGVDPNYALGLVQTWNADVSRDIRQVWNVGAGYTETRGASLDIVRAPNRGPIGLRIPGVQPFLWQTSEGSSVLHAATFRASRRPVKGHRRRRHLHAREVARQRLVDRRRRDHRRPGRSEPCRRVGAVEFRSAPSALGQPERRAAVRRRTGAGSRSRACWQSLLRRLALHARRLRCSRARRYTPRVAARGQRCRARHERHAARQLQRRARSQLVEPDDRSVLQHHAHSSIPPAGTFGNAVAQHDHRPGQPAC